MLRKFDSIINEYQTDFCKYYLNAIEILTSFDIFEKNRRKALNKVTSILVYLHKYNRHLIFYIETLWSSINYENTTEVSAQIKHLKMITYKFLRLNNKLNLMNLTVAQIWSYIHSVDESINSFFKFSSVQFCRNTLVQGKCLLI